MSKTTSKFVNSVSPDQLRRTFENSIARTLGAEPAHRPIAERNRTLGANDEVSNKRALTDAARALAQLWNISPTLIR